LLRGIAESPIPPIAAGIGVAIDSRITSGAEGVAEPFAPHHSCARVREQRSHEGGGRHAAAYRGAASGVPHACTCTVTSCAGSAHQRGDRAFEAADKLQRDYMAREKIAAEFDWHHAHNLDLLAASYQYTGQMKKAEALLKQSFNMPTNLLVQAVNKREWPAFLIARNRPAEALAAAQQLLAHPSLIVQATGHIEGGLRATGDEQAADAAASSNAALKALRSAQGAQGLAAITLEALQGEFLLRTAQRDKGRQVMESAARKWRALPGTRCVDAVAVPAGGAGADRARRR
jgi:tetratricopeptide (TPR) repeat protein